MSLYRGFAFASGSVLLVSGAQLGMRWSMTRLPEPAQWLAAISQGDVSLMALAVVFAVILAVIFFGEKVSLIAGIGVALTQPGGLCSMK